MNPDVAKQILESVINQMFIMLLQFSKLLLPPLMASMTHKIIGGLTYLVIQSLVYFILRKLFGSKAYFKSWAYFIHLVVFGLTGFLLRAIGFWIY